MSAPRSTKRVRPIVIGNWKMNGLRRAMGEVGRLLPRLGDAKGGKAQPEVMICPPATLLATMRDMVRGTPLMLGGQDCHAAQAGAHTGDISAEMLRDAGAAAVVLGHSERRADHGETDALVRAKVLATMRAGLIAIVCVGETEAERDAGQALRVVGRQLKGSLPDGMTARRLIVAYEPVWAIGTGRTPTLDDIAAMHRHIRKKLTARFDGEGARMRILYGGSVKPDNAAGIAAVPDVNGALVGGASLKAADFAPIIDAFRQG
jgi:triosephosphate isomerase